MDAQRIVRLHKALKAERSVLDTELQYCTDYVLPYGINVTDTTHPGSRRGQRRYDSTAPDAAELLAAALSDTITNPAQQWMTWEFGDEMLNDSIEAREWLEEATAEHMATLDDSNFYTQIDESWLGLVAYGTDAMYEEELPRDRNGAFTGVTFSAWPINEYVFTEDATGEANGVIRCFELPAAAARDRFMQMPRYQGMGRTIEQALRSNNLEDQQKRFRFIHAILPRDEFTTDAGPLSWAYTNDYIAVDDEHTIATGGYLEQPFAITRWRKTPDDRGWGRSPGMNALPTVLTLNEAGRLSLKAWSKDVDPPVVVEDRGVVGALRLDAGGITYARRGSRIDYLTSGGRYDITKFETELHQRAIRQMFHVEQLVQLTGEPTPQMTATEFIRRQQLMQRLLGPTFGRIQREKLARLMFRHFAILARANVLPPIPPVLQGLAATGQSIPIKVVYSGPLARAQRMGDAEAIERGLAFGASLAQLTGQPPARINADEAEKAVLELYGVPASVMRSDEQVAEMRRIQAQAAQAEAEMQQVGQATEIVGTAAQAMRE